MPRFLHPSTRHPKSIQAALCTADQTPQPILKTLVAEGKEALMDGQTRTQVQTAHGLCANRTESGLVSAECSRHQLGSAHVTWTGASCTQGARKGCSMGSGEPRSEGTAVNGVKSERLSEVRKHEDTCTWTNFQHWFPTGIVRVTEQRGRQMGAEQHSAQPLKLDVQRLQNSP